MTATGRIARDGRRAGWTLALLATLVAVVAGVRGGAGLDDDGYIFLRYASNIADGQGAVFNPGERVEGYSSPLWTLLLAGCAIVGANLEDAAIALGILTALGLFAALWRGLGRLGVSGWERAAFVLGAAIFPPVFYYAMSGLDHPIFTMLIASALVSAIRDLEARAVSARTAVLLVLCVAARNEGVLLAGWIGLLFTLLHRGLDGGWLRRVAGPLAAAGAAVAAMVAARYAYYGTIFPNTYYAKVTPDTAARFAKGAGYVAAGLPVLAPLAILAAALAAFAAWRKARLLLEPLALAGGWVAVWTGFLVYAGGDHLPMYRFWIPAIPGLVFLAGAAWSSARPRLAGAALVSARAALVAVLILAAWTAAKRQGEAAERQPRLARGWAAHGRWLAENTPPDTLVATNVIGAIGYFSGRPLIDMLGLVDATVAREGKVYSGAAHGHERYDTDYLFERAPDLVVYYTRDDIRKPGRMFTPSEAIKKRYAYALYDFVTDPRCRQRYDHILVPMEEGGLIELLKKKTFPLDALYIPAPEADG